MEVYGEKPKLFSQKWWENYFYYYKIHTIVAIVILLMAGYLIYSDVTATKYDLQIDYIGEHRIFDEQIAMIEQLANENIVDATGNDVCDSYVMLLDLSPTQDIQYAQAMQVKYMTEMRYSEAFVFIMDKKYMEEMSQSGIFEKASLWSGQDTEAECLSLAGCTAFSDAEIPADELFIAVRKLRDDEVKDERKLTEYQNGVKFAKFLIDER